MEAAAHVDESEVRAAGVDGDQGSGFDGFYGKTSDAGGVVGLLGMQVSDCHVSVADGLDFEKTMLCREQVKALVKAVQHVHNVPGSELRADGCESDYVGEEDGNLRMVLRFLRCRMSGRF